VFLQRCLFTLQGPDRRWSTLPEDLEYDGLLFGQDYRTRQGTVTYWWSSDCLGEIERGRELNTPTLLSSSGKLILDGWGSEERQKQRVEEGVCYGIRGQWRIPVPNTLAARGLELAQSLSCTWYVFSAQVVVAESHICAGLIPATSCPHSLNALRVSVYQNFAVVVCPGWKNGSFLGDKTSVFPPELWPWCTIFWAELLYDSSVKVSNHWSNVRDYCGCLYSRMTFVWMWAFARVQCEHKQQQNCKKKKVNAVVETFEGVRALRYQAVEYFLLKGEAITLQVEIVPEGSQDFQTVGSW
jgi:hypothetical protein